MSEDGASDGRPPLVEIDRLIHEPARFVIMANLYVVDAADFLFLIRQTGLTFGNLSSHMSKLEAAQNSEGARLRRAPSRSRDPNRVG